MFGLEDETLPDLTSWVAHRLLHPVQNSTISTHIFVSAFNGHHGRILSSLHRSTQGAKLVLSHVVTQARLDASISGPVGVMVDQDNSFKASVQL